MNAIPQSPPIKVHVTERHSDGTTTHEGIGRIVAWRVDSDCLIPIIWTTGYPHAIPYDNPNTTVRYHDEWE